MSAGLINTIMDKQLLKLGIDAYSRLKNLRLASEEIGVPLQTLYWNLKKNGVAVTGDKGRYGSDKDRLAARAEMLFAQLVPHAENLNDQSFQSKCDFNVGGHTVDVKAGRLSSANSKYKSKRWAFSLKKQQSIADFFVCFALDEAGDKIIKVLLIPGDLVRFMGTINLPESGGKWNGYSVQCEYVTEFFTSVILET